ncbi:MAG TPA: hypothetical protein VG870_10660, partial [Chitinophagaceae bacterium]|nr:hypothetical protein [Chitinophagaceae bacterium]
FYGEELEEIEDRLEEVIRRDSIPHLAARVEEQQSAMDSYTEAFHAIGMRFGAQERELRRDDGFLDDEDIGQDVERKQNDLRREMQKLERRFVDGKHQCQNFLSNLFRK